MIFYFILPIRGGAILEIPTFTYNPKFDKYDFGWIRIH